MTAVIADTGFYVAAVNPRDSLHAAAKGFVSDYSGRIVTTEFVLVEVANFFSQAEDRAAFVDLVRDLRASSASEIAKASTELFARGFDLFAGRSDKQWSLTACMSFVVMRDAGLTDALSADHHFEQAGFRALLLSS